MKGGLLATYIAALGIITWDEMKNFRRVPQPQRYVYATLIWVVLGFLADVGLAPLAALFGVGLVLSMAYSQYNNGNPLIVPAHEKPSQEEAPTPGPGASTAGGIGGQIFSQ